MSSYDQDRSKRRRVDAGGDYVETSRSTALFHATPGGRPWTISVAIPGSVLIACKRDEQRTTVVSQIARALAIFHVDEVVIFDDTAPESRPKSVDPQSYMGDTDPCAYLDHVLQYLEMPPFMRKVLMPLHPNLRGAGLLPSLEIPSHPNPKEELIYCEGVTTAGATVDGEGTLVDVGDKQPVSIAEEIPPKNRITLYFNPESDGKPEPVHPTAPRAEGGYYWGYTVRRCKSLSAVFEECTYENGYDVSIGTSERGTPISQTLNEKRVKELSKFNHLLVVFGGPRGLEFAAENDPELNGIGIIRARTKELFDDWVNLLPGQGSRTIKTEEALYIGLAGISRIWEAK